VHASVNLPADCTVWTAADIRCPSVHKPEPGDLWRRRVKLHIFMYIFGIYSYDVLMAYSEAPPVITVADARAGLSARLRGFRAAPETARAVTIGSHRRPEAVLVPFDQFRALSVPPGHRQVRVLALLQDRSGLIRRVASLNNIDTVAVFGSVARGTETEASDIDLLVTPSDSASLFDLAQFEIDISELTGRDVDVVSRRALSPERDKMILEGAIEL
jgi:predicted nucleotidyltransferase